MFPIIKVNEKIPEGSEYLLLVWGLWSQCLGWSWRLRRCQTDSILGINEAELMCTRDPVPLGLLGSETGIALLEDVEP